MLLAACDGDPLPAAPDDDRSGGPTLHRAIALFEYAVNHRRPDLYHSVFTESSTTVVRDGVCAPWLDDAYWAEPAGTPCGAFGVEIAVQIRQGDRVGEVFRLLGTAEVALSISPDVAVLTEFRMAFDLIRDAGDFRIQRLRISSGATPEP
jgi:hypothetical protein